MSPTTDTDVRPRAPREARKNAPRPPSISNRYRVLEQIGAGGMGCVYEAMQQSIGRRVALKVVRAQGAEEERRFLREAKALGRLVHPNVVAIYDAGRTDDGRPFLAMEYLSGGSLRAQLDARGRLPWRDTLSIVQAICAALAHVHAIGIVHRDIKPENVMVGSVRDASSVKVVDFGLAKPLKPRDDDECISRPGQILGTLAYMSPERVMANALDHPCLDLYSLGVVWYELLTGVNPFVGRTSRETLIRVCTEEPPPPSVRLPEMGIPACVDSLVMSLLQKNASHRPPSADVTVRLLEALPV